MPVKHAPRNYAAYTRLAQEVSDYMLSKTKLENNDQRYGYLVGVVAEMLNTGSVEGFRRELQAFKQGVI